MSYSHHHDKRSLGEVIQASNRISSERDSVNPYRALAVAVIGEALHDLSPVSRSFNGKPTSRRVKTMRQDDAREFMASPDLEAWAMFTSMSPQAWREVAQRIAG